MQSIDREFFITGKLQNDPLPSIAAGKRLIAFFRVIKAMAIYKTQGWKGARQYIENIKSNQESSSGSNSDEIRLARREFVYCMIVVRFFDPEVLCLSRSIAATVYLRSLGIPAQVVIGRALSLTSENYDFHAWCELYSSVVNDVEAVQQGYKVLYKMPKGDL